MEHQPELRRVLLRYSLAFFNQAAHTALSNASSVIAKRIARWILMTHDRVARNEIPLTHDVIATMLDVRRPGVTTALDELRFARLISLRRGCVVVLNRSGLQKLAGDFYGIPEKEFVRLVGTFWPPIPTTKSSFNTTPS